MDRRAWTSFAIQSGVGVPGVAFLLLLAYVAGRRRRS
jgi:MYXO-CTERM domain-containing protein